MHELRVLSGLHRGARLPLADEPCLIGAGPDCDLTLSDAGLVARHAKLWPTKHGWLLTVEDGVIHAAGGELPRSAIDLAPGDLVRVADVWLEIAATGAAWDEPPPACAAVQRRPVRTMRLMQLVAAVVFSALAYAAVFKSPAAISKTAAVPAAVAQTAAAEGKHPAKAAAAALSPHQLREAFRSRLADAALIQRFKLTLGDRSWLMHAVLDDAEMPRFQRLLYEFLREYRVSFPVSANIVGAETTLPFKIEQVVSGANASVVVRGGRRIHVGEEYLGVRLVAVKGNRLVFGGKRKIEMAW